MNALNPLALWGTLAAVGVALPVVIHLFNKARPKKVRWAAMELLMQSSQQRARKIKLQDWLLMALRCLTLLLAALAMSRCVFSSEGNYSAASPREVIIALDTSYSMHHGQFENRLALAKKRVKEIVGSLSAESRVSLVLMGEEPEVLLRHSAPDRDLLERRLETLEARPVSLSLEASVAAIEELVNASDRAQKEVLFITDAQWKSWGDLPEATKGQLKSLAEAHQVSVVPVWDGTSENLGVSDLQIVSGVSRAGGFASLSTNVTNYGQRPASTSVQLLQNGKAVDVASVGPLQPGEQQVIRMGVQLEQAGLNKFEVSIDQDNLTEDNQAYLAVHVPELLQVLMIEGREREGRYLDLALQLKRSGYAQGLESTTRLAAEVQAQDVEGADVIVLANVGDLSETVLSALKERVHGGAGLMVYAGDQMDDFAAQRILGKITPIEWESSTALEAGEMHHAEVVEQAHRMSQELIRLEADLADCQVRAYHSVKTAANANVLLRLSNGVPLLMLQPAGKGMMALITTGAERRWSSLPLNPAGPILFHLLLDEVSTLNSRQAYRVGESISMSIPSEKLGAEPKLIHPNGKTSIPQRVRQSSEQQNILLDIGEAEVPGFYQLEIGGEGDSRLLAANIDTQESAVQPVNLRELQSSLKDLGIYVEGNGNTREQGSKQTHLASYFALAALLLMISQGALSMQLTRRKKQQNATIRTGFGVGIKTEL